MQTKEDDIRALLATTGNNKLDEIGWYIEANNKFHAKSLEDFLKIKKSKNLPERNPNYKNIALAFYKNHTKANKIGSIEIAFVIKGEGEYFQFEIGSDSKSEIIYSEFKTFFGKLGWTSYVPDLGKDCWITYISPKFHLPAEAEELINQINKYDPLPAIIEFQVKAACGILLTETIIIDLKINGYTEYLKEAINVLDTLGYTEAVKLVPSLKESPLQHDQIMLILADLCFADHNFEDAINAYSSVSKQIPELYKKAQYQLGNIFLQTHSSEYDSQRDHAKKCLPYYVESIGYQDSLDICKKLFYCLCYESNNEKLDKNFPFPAGANADVIIELAEFIYQSVQRREELLEEKKSLANKLEKLTITKNSSAEEKKHTSTPTFFNSNMQMNDNRALLATTSNNKLDEIGWFIAANNKFFAKSLEDFLTIKKSKNSPEHDPNHKDIALAFYKKHTKANKIGLIEIIFVIDGKGEYFQFVIGSDSKSKIIYSEFKAFFGKLGWTLDSDYGKDYWINFISPKFHLPAEAEKFINQINSYDPLPLVIEFQVRVACGILSKETIINILNTSGYNEAVKLVRPLKKFPLQHDQIMLLLADACFEDSNFEDAIDAYSSVSKQTPELYKKAQYQLGSILFVKTSSSEYGSQRDHAKKCLPHYVESIGYQDSLDICKKLFVCLCYGSYKILEKNAPFPNGASANTIIELGELIYQSIQCKEKLLVENKSLESKNNNLTDGFEKLTLTEEDSVTEEMQHNSIPKFF